MRSIHLPLECSGSPAHTRFNLISESTVFPCVCVSLFCIVFKDRFCAACKSFPPSLADSLIIISPLLKFVNPVFPLFLRFYASPRFKYEHSFCFSSCCSNSPLKTSSMRGNLECIPLFFRIKGRAENFLRALASGCQNSCAPCAACSCWVVLYSAYQSGISVEKRCTNQFIIFTAFSMFPE